MELPYNLVGSVFLSVVLIFVSGLLLPLNLSVCSDPVNVATGAQHSAVPLNPYNGVLAICLPKDLTGESLMVQG